MKSQDKTNLRFCVPLYTAVSEKLNKPMLCLCEGEL